MLTFSEYCEVLLAPLIITLCLGAAWLGVPRLGQPLPQAAHHGGGRPAHVQQRAQRRGGQRTLDNCQLWSWCLKTETTNITIGYDSLLRINICSGILSGHDIFLSAYWLGWAGLGWWDADFAIFIQ